MPFARVVKNGSNSNVYALNVTRSRPKIGTEARLEIEEPHFMHDPGSRYLRITIYNAGELAATQLQGYFKLSSSDDSIQEFTVPIVREFLDSARPYDLEPKRLVWTKSYWDQTRFNVNIEFDYFGFPPDKPEHYTATYHFDHERNCFVKD